MIKGKTYPERSLSQTFLWANGKPYHNHVDDECCPDFSCCHPELFTADIEKRRRSYLRALENSEFTRSKEQQNEVSSDEINVYDEPPEFVVLTQRLRGEVDGE